MVRTAWQDLKLNDVKLKCVGGQQFLADLVLADPWYTVQHQPKLSEQTIARKLFDLVSRDGTVFIIFGRPELLFSHWAPIFEKRLNGSEVECKIHSNMWHVV